MPEETKPQAPAAKPYFMTPELVSKLYAVFNAKPTEGRLISKVTVTLEAGKPATLVEETYPIEVPLAPQLNDNTDTKADA